MFTSRVTVNFSLRRGQPPNGPSRVSWQRRATRVGTSENTSTHYLSSPNWRPAWGTRSNEGSGSRPARTSPAKLDPHLRRHPAHFLRPRLEELPKGAAANTMLEGLEAALRSPNLLANERHCQLSVIRRGGMQRRLASGLQLNSLQHILGAA